MKGVVIYTGKYGATRQYADWIREQLDLPVLTPDKVNPENLTNNDFLVIGSSVYIGKLLIRDWLRQNMSILQNKMLFLFVVCASAKKNEQSDIIENNVPVLLRNRCKIFFLPGRLVTKKLSWKDWLLLKIGSRFEKDPVKKKAMRQDIDGVKKENLAETIESIQAFTSGKDVFVKAGQTV